MSEDNLDPFYEYDAPQFVDFNVLDDEANLEEYFSEFASRSHR